MTAMATPALHIQVDRFRQADRRRRDRPGGGPDGQGGAQAFIPTGEGWLYPAAVEGLHSRKIVGRSSGGRSDSRLVVDAPEMAVSRRLPGAGLAAPPTRTGGASTPACIG